MATKIPIDDNVAGITNYNIQFMTFHPQPRSLIENRFSQAISNVGYVVWPKFVDNLLNFMLLLESIRMQVRLLMCRTGLVISYCG